MAATAARDQKKKQILPGSLHAKLITGANKIAGAICLGSALYFWVCLLSWSVADPSLSRAFDGPIHNWGGKNGAIIADILFQGFGLASIILILPLAVFGIQLLQDRPINHWRLRITAWPLSVWLLTLALSMIPVAETWPLTQTYGGIIGDTLGKIIPLSALPQNTLYASLCFCILLGLAVATLLFTLSLKPGDARILFDVRDQAELKALLKSPFRRLSYWQTSKSLRQETNHHNPNARLWWRNALWDETQTEAPTQTPQPPLPAAQPAIHAPLQNQREHQDQRRTPHKMGRPAVPAKKNPAKWTNLPPNGLPPMSANPSYNHPYEFEPVAKGLGPANQTPGAHHTGAPLAPQPNSINRGRGHEFILPPIELLTPWNGEQTNQFSHEELTEMALLLENVLLDFGVKGSILNVRPGPVVTLFEFEPARGIKTARIIGLADDIARSMSAYSARIAVIQGRNAIGIELPNHTSETVYIRELVEHPDFYHSELPLPLALGKSISGEPVITDLSAMPHLLIAGTTGSGKSVGINTMLLSLLYRLTPEECRLILIDPKMLELSIYEGIPHLLTPVVTDPNKALAALKWAVREMEDRYRQMSKLGVRNIDGFNEKVKQAAQKGESITRTVQTGFDQATGRAIFEEEQLSFETMPKIVVVIDEMADLMMVAGKEIEMAVQRLAQMARAAGIHVIMATQRPSVDVITGTIKANFPTRISFQVTSKIDSRTILGKEGAEALLGRGDMLYMPGASRINRVHGAYVDDSEVERVVAHLRAQGAPEYIDAVIEDEDPADGSATQTSNGEPDIYQQALEIVVRDQKATISYLQRRLSIGYNRAATLIERMENEGVVSPANRAGKREVYLDQI